MSRLDNGRRVGTGAKHGFCYFDNTPYRLWLPGAPSASVYGGCGTAGDLRVTTRLSAGIAFQWIDITGLKSGCYRLRATPDPVNFPACGPTQALTPSPAAALALPRGVARPRRVVRFARLMHWRGRVLGGPAVRTAYGGNVILPGPTQSGLSALFQVTS